ncbi:expressed unknown protein [Seminavis robusta]|uniref:Uncharacterized protein n=1 Tax=Seminavis robusta TaxID=568900 RepID=A0A9N8E7V1_9STRA|nr:expressed unknown protein [Seminavis robusta]|eukprot:Sro589_g171770.1 n/a (149) ;mRNA; r:35359-35805
MNKSVAWKRPRTKKSVRFANTRAVVTLSPEKEADSTWYAHQEYRSMKDVCKQDVVAYARARKSGTKSLFDASQNSVRGLENLFPPNKRRYDMLKKQRMSAILGHQHQQKSCGFKDPASLAFLSELFSRGARERAIELARRDSMVWFSP